MGYTNLPLGFGVLGRFLLLADGGLFQHLHRVQLVVVDAADLAHQEDLAVC